MVNDSEVKRSQAIKGIQCFHMHSASEIDDRMIDAQHSTQRNKALIKTE